MPRAVDLQVVIAIRDGAPNSPPHRLVPGADGRLCVSNRLESGLLAGLFVGEHDRRETADVGVLSAGDLERRRAGVAGEMRRGGEARGPSGAATSRPAMIGPTSTVWDRRLPSAVTVSWSRLPITASRRSGPRVSATCLRVTCLRVWSAGVSGHTPRGISRR